jgi:hypothetical protein
VSCSLISACNLRTKTFGEAADLPSRMRVTDPYGVGGRVGTSLAKNLGMGI